jgi:cytochrome c oxidase cbb3-type subunit 3
LRVLLIVAPLALGACEREKRVLDPGPAASVPATSTATVPVQVGAPTVKSPLDAPTMKSAPKSVDNNAYDLAQGKQLYNAYNCSGCHAQGGGDKGPALMDDVWIYGADPANVYASIVEGRPNGMPSFRSHIPEFQVWQLVGYVRSMSGLGSSVAAPSRNDGMQAKESESRVETQPPRAVSDAAPAGRAP